jgi:formiminotetrahydrofolate cyclodeaminase
MGFGPVSSVAEPNLYSYPLAMPETPAECSPNLTEGRDPAKSAACSLSAGVAEFIEQLAAPTPTPAGGSASGAAAAMAAGLACMVAAISRGKKAHLQHESRFSEALSRLTTLRQELTSAIDADAESYQAVMKACKMARDSSGGRREMNAALRGATRVPLGVAEKAAEVAGIATVLRSITSPSMKSDLTIAIALARAACEGSLTNVRVNLDLIKPDSPEEQSFVSETRKRAEALNVQA